MQNRKTLTLRRFWNRYWSFVLMPLAIIPICLMLLCVNPVEAAGNEDPEGEVRAMSMQDVKYAPPPVNEYGIGIAEEMDPDYREVPDVDTSMKTYMTYKAITNKSSTQWKLQQRAITNQYGFRELDGMYMVAMGTYYSDHAGAMFRITLENGTTFKAIMGDVKADQHTDARNQHRGGNVVEFIVDTPKLASDARVMGDVSYTPGASLTGPIETIEYLGEYQF